MSWVAANRTAGEPGMDHVANLSCWNTVGLSLAALWYCACTQAAQSVAHRSATVFCSVVLCISWMWMARCPLGTLYQNQLVLVSLLISRRGPARSLAHEKLKYCCLKLVFHVSTDTSKLIDLYCCATSALACGSLTISESTMKKRCQPRVDMKLEVTLCRIVCLDTRSNRANPLLRLSEPCWE